MKTWSVRMISWWTRMGTLAIARLTGLPFLPALAVLSVIQLLLGVYGYNLIHRFETVSAVILAALFVVMTVIGE